MGRRQRKRRDISPTSFKPGVIANVSVTWWGNKPLETSIEHGNEDCSAKFNDSVPTNNLPTPIQETAWKYSSYNTVLIAPTGSGKTLAFGAPLLRNKKALIVAPTRELVQQIARELGQSASRLSVDCQIGIFHGGVNIQQHMKQLETARIVVTTPGRWLDLLSQNSTALFAPETLVLDEADRFAAQSDLFQQVSKIVETTTTASRVVCVSATCPVEAQEQWKKWMGKDSSVAVIRANAKTTTSVEASATLSAATSRDWLSTIPPAVTQIAQVCATHKKPRKLLKRLEAIRSEKGLCIVFFNTIQTLETMSQLCTKHKILNVTLHSHKSQQDREAAVRIFTSGRIPTLFATDVAARGLHVPHVRHVIQYDFATTIPQYIHRCGRTQNGTATSFFTRNLRPLAADLVELLQSTNQMVDPNLLALAQKTVSVAKRQRTEPGLDVDDYEDFPGLGRVALKRAAHVSDASAEDDDGSNASSSSSRGS